MTPRRLLVIAIGTVILTAVPLLVITITGSRSSGGSATSRIDGRAPAGARVRVEVLNGGGVRGTARRATLHLRDRGFDVVYFGNADAPRDSTVVLDRSGQPNWAQAVADALGGVPVRSEPDSLRYLDVTVLLGGDWRPPAEPLHP